MTENLPKANVIKASTDTNTLPHIPKHTHTHTNWGDLINYQSVLHSSIESKDIEVVLK